VEHANATRPILHEDTVELLRFYLAVKKASGTRAERALYAEVGRCPGRRGGRARLAH
jgi:hypothetical protein